MSRLVETVVLIAAPDQEWTVLWCRVLPGWAVWDRPVRFAICLDVPG